jgi:hypothetical protein
VPNIFRKKFYIKIFKNFNVLKCVYKFKAILEWVFQLNKLIQIQKCIINSADDLRLPNTNIRKIGPQYIAQYTIFV